MRRLIDKNKRYILIVGYRLHGYTDIFTRIFFLKHGYFLNKNKNQKVIRVLGPRIILKCTLENTDNFNTDINKTRIILTRILIKHGCFMK